MQATHDLTAIGPGDAARNTIRIAAYWLCTALLAWSSELPRSELRLLPATGFLLASSLAICGLAYASSVARNYLSKAGLLSTGESLDYQGLLARKISHTGFIALEILAVLSVVIALQRLML